MGRLSKPELLVPAGSLEVLKTAVRYGADAVYIGGEAFSLRAKAKNFSEKDMAEGIAYAHAHGVKVYRQFAGLCVRDGGCFARQRHRALYVAGHPRRVQSLADSGILRPDAGALSVPAF